MESDEEQMTEINELLNQVEAFEINDEVEDPSLRTNRVGRRPRKRRFLIEKLISLPKQWFTSTIGSNRDEVIGSPTGTVTEYETTSERSTPHSNSNISGSGGGDCS